MIIKGKVFVFGDHVNTDEIIPARYLSTSDPVELAKYCMEDIQPGFGQRSDIRGAVIVAGENFGCGSSREHAPLAIKAAGVSLVLARSFARIFSRNAINIGLPLVEIPREAILTAESSIEADLEQGFVMDCLSGQRWRIQPYPPFLQDIIRCGGWLNYALLHLKPQEVGK